MIIDHLSNAHLYSKLQPGFMLAFETLQKAELAGRAVGKYPLDGENIYAMVQEYNTKPLEQGNWEAHRRYIDLQYIVHGIERIAFANIGRLEQGIFDPGRDFLPLHGQGDFLSMPAGYFMLLFPQDAHMPGLAIDFPSPIKKIVIKIAVP